MNYAQTAGRANPAAMLGALGVPAAFGAVLILGLAVTVVVDPPESNPDAVFITPTPPEIPPPPPETQPQAKESTQTPQTSTYIPPTRPDTQFELSNSPPITTLPDFGVEPIGPIDLGAPVGTKTPTPVLPDPISASPRNSPGRWVTDNDYRSRWVREGLTGVAGFALTIGRDGKVRDCTITKSSGHSPLDEATCKLIKSRAKFDPAKDSQGNPVSGTYRSSVNWKLP